MIAVGRTDVGRQRPANEDSILVVPERGLVVVADGMGGHRGGRVASHMVTGEIARISQESREPLDGDALVQALIEVNLRVHETGEANEDLHAMGSTCVAVSVVGDIAHVVHVGDSRCYRCGPSGEGQVTVDHRAIQPMIDTGALTESESRSHPLRNVLTRSVGVEAKVSVDRQDVPVQPGDRFLLCSDGLSDLVPETEILRALGSKDRDLAALADGLIAAANAAGGHDNISVVVAEVE